MTTLELLAWYFPGSATAREVGRAARLGVNLRALERFAALATAAADGAERHNIAHHQNRRAAAWYRTIED